MPSHKYDDSKQHPKDRIAHRKIMNKKIDEASKSKRIAQEERQKFEDMGYKRVIFGEYEPPIIEEIGKEIPPIIFKKDEKPPIGEPIMVEMVEVEEKDFPPKKKAEDKRLISLEKARAAKAAKAEAKIKALQDEVALLKAEQELSKGEDAVIEKNGE
jgi:hypothetical protein